MCCVFYPVLNLVCRNSKEKIVSQKLSVICSVLTFSVASGIYVYTHKLNCCLEHFCNCAVETLSSKADSWHQPCVRATLQYIRREGAFQM